MFLDPDVNFTKDLSQQFKLIGKYSTYCFLITSNGQGHVISNLTMNTLQYVRQRLIIQKD